MLLVKQSIKTFFFIAITTILTLFVLVQRNNRTNQSVFSASLSVTITPIQTKVSDVSIMDSPDGTMTLTLISHSLFISSKSDPQERQIFRNEEVNPDNLEIPFNTWSPDNIYVFLKKKTSSINDYLVFQASGNLFSNNLPYVSIQELFKINLPEYLITDVTGWAAPNLLIVNAKLIAEDKKISFWFDVPSQSFIQLGTYFN